MNHPGPLCFVLCIYWTTSTWTTYPIVQTENAISAILSRKISTVRGPSRWFNADHDRGQILSFSSPSRIRRTQWANVFYKPTCTKYLGRIKFALKINGTSLFQGEALDKDLNTLKLSHMISYWKTIPEVGTLSVLGLLTVRDLMHYIQYYFIPIMTILATPIIRLIMSLYSIYHVSWHHNWLCIQHIFVSYAPLLYTFW